MLEDEVEVSLLPGAAQVFRASARADRLCRYSFPAGDDRRCVAEGLVTRLDQSLRDAGAAELVFLAKFTARAGSDERDPVVIEYEMGGQRFLVAKTADVDRLAIQPAPHEARPGGREQHHGPLNVAAYVEGRRAVLKVESVGQRTAQLPDQQWIFEQPRHGDRLIDRDRRQAAPATRDGGHSRGACPDYVDRDQRVAVLVTRQAFGKAVDHDGPGHALPSAAWAAGSARRGRRF